MLGATGVVVFHLGKEQAMIPQERHAFRPWFYDVGCCETPAQERSGPPPRSHGSGGGPILCEIGTGGDSVLRHRSDESPPSRVEKCLPSSVIEAKCWMGHSSQAQVLRQGPSPNWTCRSTCSPRPQQSGRGSKSPAERPPPKGVRRIEIGDASLAAPSPAA